MRMVRSSTLFVFVLGACSDPGRDVCNDPGVACVWAGTGERGFNIKNPTADRLDSKIYFPEDLTFAPDDTAYIVDWNNHMIRHVEKDGRTITVVGTDYEGDGPPGEIDRLPECMPQGSEGDLVAMNHPTDVEFGKDGLLYIAAWHNNKIRVYDPATGYVRVLAGAGYGYKGDNGPACKVLFNQPKALAFAPDNTLYVVDQRNVRVRAIQPDVERTTTTIAGGLGLVGYEGDGGPAFNARFGFEVGTTPRPSGALVYDNHTLYIADSSNNRIRKIDLATNIIECIAGKLEAGYSGDGGPALDAHFNFPSDIELGPDGRLYIADRLNNVIRAMDLVTGTVETVAGTGAKCNVEVGDGCPDHLPAREVGLQEPYGIAFDAAGNLYIADTHNSRILRVAR